MSNNAFSKLDLKPELLDNLASLNYEEMTAIQAHSLPLILEGKDVIAQAKTGSGKTAAFGLGLLQRLNVKRFRVQSLVLCPTRELADQVAKEIRKFARGIHNIKVLTLCGGTPFGPQIGSLEHGAHIIVGTPGRIEEHLLKGRLNLDEVSTLVLDEADRMLDMGFQDVIQEITSHTPRERQTLLFSATFPEKMNSATKNILRNPTRVEVDVAHTGNAIAQRFLNVDELPVKEHALPECRFPSADARRITAIRMLLQQYEPESTVIFCNTRHETQAVADELSGFGYFADALHGDLDQRQRDQTLVRFANKSLSILVATDVAARGLDIESLDAVINYQLSKDPEVHVHRVGRTGRAGNKGSAFTLFCNNERFKLEKLEETLGIQAEYEGFPAASILEKPAYKPVMTTLQIDGGKKQKVRPGDILGALTGKNGIEGSQVGKIQIYDQCAYVAVAQDIHRRALNIIGQGKMKGKSFRVRRV